MSNSVGNSVGNVIYRNTFIDVVTKADSGKRRSRSAPAELRTRLLFEKPADSGNDPDTEPEPVNEPDSDMEQQRRLPQHPRQDAPELDYTGETLPLAEGNFEAPPPHGPRRRRRRAAKPPRPSPTFLSQVEQAGSTQEIFQMCIPLHASPQKQQEISLDSIVSVLRLAAKKFSEGTRIQDNLGFLACMQTLERQMSTMDGHSLPKVFWSLGKLEAGNRSEKFIRQAGTMILRGVYSITEFSTPELSNCLYGLAKMSCKREEEIQEDLAIAFIVELQQRVDSWTPQCLSNSVYALALFDKLGIRLQRDAAEHFLEVCRMQLCGDPELFKKFTSQGISNTVWALARKKSPARDTSTWRLLIHARDASAYRLDEFCPQELSIFAWSVAKLMESSRSNQRPSQTTVAAGSIESFVVAMANTAGQKMPFLSAQSISNVAYALASVRSLSDPQALGFVSSAAEYASSRLAQWQPQAIANFLYVLGQLPVLQRMPRGVGNTQTDHVRKAMLFADAAAMECERRIHCFSWQDLSGIISPLGKTSSFRTPIAKHMVTCVVVTHSPGHCWQMSTQSMLNIALAAISLGIDKSLMVPMVRDISGEIARRTPKVKSIDLKQWAKIQQAMSA